LGFSFLLAITGELVAPSASKLAAVLLAASNRLRLVVFAPFMTSSPDTLGI
jgi:hypothetical protein